MKQKIVIITLILLLIVCIVVFLIFYNREIFVGNRIANQNSYSLDIERMNGKDEHLLDLKSGDTLIIRFEPAEGTLHVEIKAPDSNVVYVGNGIDEAKDFTVNVRESGVYKIEVKARHAKGKISIQRKEILP